MPVGPPGLTVASAYFCTGAYRVGITLGCAPALPPTSPGALLRDGYMSRRSSIVLVIVLLDLHEREHPVEKMPTDVANHQIGSRLRFLGENRACTDTRTEAGNDTDSTRFGALDLVSLPGTMGLAGVACVFRGPPAGLIPR